MHTQNQEKIDYKRIIYEQWKRKFYSPGLCAHAIGQGFLFKLFTD